MKMKVVIEGQTYTVEVIDIHARPVKAMIEGKIFEVWPEDENFASNVVQTEAPLISVPEPVSKPGAIGATNTTQQSDQVQAPLPGVIVAVLVKPGDTVSRGQELCTLEAMKMKNAIKSSREGTIKSIDINIGDQVNHGQLLMTFTE